MGAELPKPIQLRHPGGAQILVRCLKYLRPYWPYTAISYLLLLANSGSTLLIPQVIGAMVDEGIGGGQIGIIRQGSLGLLALVVVRDAFTYLAGRWTEVASQSVAYDLRNEVHDKLQSLSFSYHDQSETGQLLARAVGDVDRVRFLTGRALIQGALHRLLSGRTAIVTAHRLSTVRNADRIYVIDEGWIVEQGSHSALLERGGLYRDLYERQFIAWEGNGS
jgi:ABC-type multidrug transport system fused ATPase/permease subunit